MLIPKAIVLEWIGRNMNMTQIDMKDFPKLPGGVLTTDKNTGEKLLIFYDCLNNAVMSGKPANKKHKSYVFC